MMRTPASRVRSRATAIVAVAVIGVSVTACGERGAQQQKQAATPAADGASPSKPGETYYWLSQATTLPLFKASDHVALRRAAAQLGVKAVIAGPTGQDLGQFIATINQVCSRKPAGVMIVGWDPSETAAADDCMRQGVPTVTVDADLPKSHRLAFVGTDWYQIGVAEAEGMKKALPNGGKVATTSIISADNMTQARKGFSDTLRGSNIQVVANEDDGADEAKAAEKTSSLLAAHTDLAGMAGFDSNSGGGIVQALKEAGKAGGKVKVTTVEEQSPKFLEEIKSGNVQTVVMQKRALFTYYGLKLLYDYNHSGLSVHGIPKDVSSPIPANVDTGLLVVDRDNVDAVLTQIGKSSK